MKHNFSAFAATALVALSLGAPVLAQGPGGGAGGGGGFGGPRRMPFAMGAVTNMDAAAGTITITPQFGGNGPQTIKVGSDIQITTLTTVAVADLKVGDQIAVQGVPTGITATQIIAGTAPAGLPGGGGGGPRGGGPGGNGGGNAAAGAASQSYALATGTIKTLPLTATDPLVISMGTDVTLSLTVPTTAKVSKYNTLALGSVKVGDQVMAAGQAADDGTFTATSVGVNLPMNNGGPGGFGGRGGGRGRRGGGGGFGGPGGGGPGGGGPGAPGGGAPPPPVQ